MSRASPPEKGRGRPGDKPDRTSRRSKNNGGTIPNRPTSVKRLLAQHGRCWLFEITEGRDVRYQVEKNDLVLRFGLLFQAEGRFLRLSKKEPQP